jgi:hypothetical protein
MKQEIELKIEKVLNDFIEEKQKNGYIGDGLWTERIKANLAELGEAENCQVASSGFAGWLEPEWLYDLVWYKENKVGQLSEVVLIAESEWGKNWKSIKYDFEKLLQSDATYKLMICQCYKGKRNQLIEKFNESIKAYKKRKTGDRYLLAILDIEDEVFHFKLIE